MSKTIKHVLICQEKLKQRHVKEFASHCIMTITERYTGHRGDVMS